MSERLVDRIGALLAKAESTDSEHERDALVSKAQELATANAISLEAARQRKKDTTKRERPVQKTIRLFDHYDRSRTKSFFVLLWVTIARENDVECNVYNDSSGVIAFGMDSDIEVVETLYTSLAVQMVAAGDAYIKSGEYKNEYIDVIKRDRWGDVWVEYKPVHGQTARRNFYEGFRNAIGDRLAQAREAAEAQVVSPVDNGEGVALADDSAPVVPVTGDLVLRSKREEVSEFYRANTRARGSYRGGRASGYATGAQSAGRQAGRNAHLGGSPTAVGGAKRAIG